MGILDMKFFRFIGIKKKPKAPWEKFYRRKHRTIIVPDETIYEYLKRHADKYLDHVAIEYYGTKYTYQELLDQIEKSAKAFKNAGIRKGDVVSILSANTPEALFAFYGLNKIGAVANMLHPLLSENEMKQALKQYSTVMVVAMDVTYSKLKNILNHLIYLIT